MTADGRRHEDLVEPEGVNADPTTESPVDPHADVRRGGDPAGPHSDPRADEPKVVQPPWDKHDPDASSVEWYREEGAE